MLLGLRAAGGNYKALHQACARLEIEAPVWTGGPPDGRCYRSAPDHIVFCENSTYHNRSQIKSRLVASGIPNQCAECALESEWNGRPLTLQLDHINGVFNDNRPENLRILCPNCHSQTDTFAGRSARLRPVAVNTLACIRCAHLNRSTAKRCSACHHWFVRLPGNHKIDWPEDSELLRLVQEGSFVAAGKLLGVSDTAVRKRLKSRGLLTQSPHQVLTPAGVRTRVA